MKEQRGTNMNPIKVARLKAAIQIAELPLLIFFINIGNRCDRKLNIDKEGFRVSNINIHDYVIYRCSSGVEYVK